MDIIRASGVMVSAFKENSGLLSERFKLKLFKTLSRCKMTKLDFSILDTIIKAASDKPVIIYGDEVFTAKKFSERGYQLANALVDLGLKKGDIIPASIRNSNQRMEYFFAGFRTSILGANNLNWYYTPKEVELMLNQFDAKAVLIDEDFIDKFEPIIQNTQVKSVIVRRTGLNRELPKDWLEYEELIARYPKTPPKLPWELPPLDSNDTIFLAATTGTTGLAKVVKAGPKILTGMLEDGGALIGAFLPEIANLPSRYKLGEVFKLPILDTLLQNSLVEAILREPATGELLAKITKNFAPIIWKKMSLESLRGPVYLLMRLLSGRFKALCLGLIGVGATAMAAFFPLIGQCDILPKSKHFDGKLNWEMVDRYKPDMVFLPGNTPAKMMLDAAEPGRYDTSSVRLIVTAGSWIDIDYARRLIDLCPNAVWVDWFGATEAWIGAFSFYSREDLNNPKLKTTSRWKKPSYWSIRDEDGNPVPVGTVGCLWQHAGTLAKGYYKEPEKKGKKHIVKFGPGWVNVGDLMVEDEDGYVSFVERGGGVITTGAYKVWNKEVEDILSKNPKIEKVVVTGVPDEKWGEAVTAVVKLKEGERSREDEIIGWCKENMGGFKVPKHVLFTDEVADEYFSTEYIKGGGGKHPREDKIREWAMEKLGIKEKK